MGEVKPHFEIICTCHVYNMLFASVNRRSELFCPNKNSEKTAFRLDEWDFFIKAFFERYFDDWNRRTKRHKGGFFGQIKSGLKFNWICKTSCTTWSWRDGTNMYMLLERRAKKVKHDMKLGAQNLSRKHLHAQALLILKHASYICIRGAYACNWQEL